jgi:ubiquinone/menaquinone biosynthesis C-methylase UbiE
MFDRIAGRYDLMNTVMSAGLHHRWRARAVELARVGLGGRALDVCCGTGDLALALSEAVGPTGEVVGLDFSEPMLEHARAKTAARGFDIEYVQGNALELPFEDASFDAVVTTQVYEYVSDVPKALREARRVLRPGARLLVLDTDWDSVVWHSSDPARMARILDVWNRHLADPYLPRRLPGMLRATGFRLDRSAVIPLFNQGWNVDSFSAFIVDTVASFAIRTGISEREVSAWADDLRGLGEDAFFSLNRYVFLATARQA